MLLSDLSCSSATLWSPGARAAHFAKAATGKPLDVWFLETGHPFCTVLLFVKLRTAPVHSAGPSTAPAEISPLGMAV